MAMKCVYRKRPIGPRRYRKGKGKGGYRRPYCRTGGKVARLSYPVRPDKALVKLNYEFDAHIVKATAGACTQVFALNSIYDPDTSGLGHQPLGYDQWSRFYQNYRVYKLSYELTVANTNTAAPVRIGVLNAPVAYTGNPNLALLEQPHCRKFTCGSFQGVDTKKIKGVVAIPTILGMTREQYRTNFNAAGAMSPSSGTNPALRAYMNIIFQNMDSTFNTNLLLSLRLTYHVELFNPVVLALSYTPNEDVEAVEGSQVVNPVSDRPD